MQVAPMPNNESNRLKNLLSYGILDTKKEKHFDDLAELIANVCNCQYALITFIDQKRQWFKSTRQIKISESTRDISFCAHTILQDDVMVIRNTKKDKRFFDNPFVTKGYRISFYAGAPIITTAGYKIGAVCALDKKTKNVFTAKQKNALKIIANQVTTLVELGVKNRLVTEQKNAVVAEFQKIAQQTLTGQDEEKVFIANELHENFAQTLAATNLYLDFAEQSKETGVDFIKQGKSFITQMIKDIKVLSKSMLPTTYENADYLEFIQEMLNEYGLHNNIKISFRHHGKLDCYTADIGLCLFRVIQYQLRIAKHCKANKIAIKINTGDSIHLEITDDGKEDPAELERIRLLKHIETRIGILKGTTYAGYDKSKLNLLDIEIPLQK